LPGNSQTVSHLIIITTLWGRNPGFYFPMRKLRLRMKQFFWVNAALLWSQVYALHAVWDLQRRGKFQRKKL
jgi:hypothetical protein